MKLCAQAARARREDHAWPRGVARAARSVSHRSSATDAREFLDKLVSHYVFDDGKLVVAHAGLKEEMHGRGSGAVRAVRMYGETTGETDEFGLPVRYNWAADYRGKAMVVYGHTPVPSRNGSTTRSASIPAACSAASSRRCAIRSESWSRFRRSGRTTSRCGRCVPAASRSSLTAQQAARRRARSRRRRRQAHYRHAAASQRSRSARRTRAPRWR